jgi:amino acid transporter
MTSSTSKPSSRATRVLDAIRPSPPRNLRSEAFVRSAMPSLLGSWDMTTTFVASTYLASCASTIALGGPAAFSYLLLIGFTFFIPCLIATAQLGHMHPHEGALYNWAYRCIGGYWSFFAACCAWLPGILISSSLASLLVTYSAQAFYPTLLDHPWQQSIAISLILASSGLIATCRLRLLKNIVNVLVVMMFLGTILSSLACLLWLHQGHASATTFTHWSDWSFKPENFVMFSLVAFAYFGTEGPLTMAGEITGHYVVTRHLKWGAILLFLTYIFNTLAILVVMGKQETYDPFALVTTVHKVLGDDFAIVTSICLMCSFLATILVYTYLYARLLFVAGIDQRLPASIGKLTKHQAPTNAIILQTILAIAFTILIFNIAPFVILVDRPKDFSTEIYHISQASAALIWTISSAFLFICLIGSYIQNPNFFYSQRIFPMAIIWASVIIGLLSCILTTIDTLLFSWTNLLPNYQWWYCVGGLTILFLAISVLISIFTKSEVDWQSLNAALKDTAKTGVVHK